MNDEYYMSEGCAYFALALREIYGFDIAILVDRGQTDDFGGKEFPAVYHVFCVTPDYKAVDVRGEMPVNQVQGRWSHELINPSIEYVSDSQLISDWMGSGKPLFGYSKREIAEAKEYILKKSSMFEVRMTDPLIEQLRRTSSDEEVLEEAIFTALALGALTIAAGYATKKYLWPLLKKFVSRKKRKFVQKLIREELAAVLTEAIFQRPSKMSFWPEDEWFTAVVYFPLDRWDTINRIIDLLDLDNTEKKKVDVDRLEKQIGKALRDVASDEEVMEKLEEAIDKKHKKWRKQARDEYEEWQEQVMLSSDEPRDELEAQLKSFEIAWDQAVLRPFSNPTKHRKWNLSFAKDLSLYY